MAQVPYAHVEAPQIIRIDGVRAFNVGDPVPLDTARRLGLLDGDDAPPILSGEGIAASPDFTDAELKVAADSAAAGANLSDAPTAPEPTPPQGRPKSPTT